MDADTLSRFSALYGLWAAVVLIGSCLGGGPGGTLWARGGPPVPAVLALLGLLVWSALDARGRFSQPLGLAAAAVVAGLTMSWSGDGPVSPGGQLLSGAVLIVLFMALAQLVLLARAAAEAEERASVRPVPEEDPSS